MQVLDYISNQIVYKIQLKDEFQYQLTQSLELDMSTDNGLDLKLKFQPDTDQDSQLKVMPISRKSQPSVTIWIWWMAG